MTEGGGSGRGGSEGREEERGGGGGAFELPVPVLQVLPSLLLPASTGDQEGVVRTNCFDSLDRTNMVQTFLARRVLEVVLCHIDLMLQRPGLDLQLAFPPRRRPCGPSGQTTATSSRGATLAPGP